MDKKINDIMKNDTSYPLYDDKNFQLKIYNKREFYYHKVPYRELINEKDYDKVKQFRDKVCGGNFEPRSHQHLLANFINPDTPFRGLLLYHGLGTGKTGCGVTIAEKFKDQIKKYNTKIYILVPGPLIKESWIDEIVKFTKNTYLKNNNLYIDEENQKNETKKAKQMLQQYYRILTHKSFHRKVLGERIIIKDDKMKEKYKKDKQGNLERILSIEKITSLDNTLLIIDEVHGVTGNELGKSVKQIIKNSVNLKLLLLSATPMINTADEIIEILNFLRPLNDQIIKDKVFNMKDDKLILDDNGKNYLRKMSNGYVSHYRGANPLTFAKEVEMGGLYNEFIFTKLIKCPMQQFQEKIYYSTTKNINDSLDKKTQSIANFCFPCLNNNELDFCFAKDGLNDLYINLKDNKDYKLRLNMLINQTILKNKYGKNETVINIQQSNKTISGLILKEENLINFSSKFHRALIELNQLVNGKKGAGTAFVYFNLIKVGVELFEQVLIENGYFRYREDRKYNINDYSRDAMTGKYKKDCDNNFYPCTFFSMIGQQNENVMSKEDSKYILDNVFSNVNNRYGQFIKIVIGSKVMNEGITLENIAEIHIMDVYYNLGKLMQAIGRGIRECKHYNITNEDNKFPEVRTYKYVVSYVNHKNLSGEEDLYRISEKKILLIKDVERVLKEAAIDCALNYNANIFPEEINKYKKCIVAKEAKKGDFVCPMQCDLQKCEFECFSHDLNLKYYDRNNKLYKQLTKDKIDFSTFSKTLARTEIDNVKDKIKSLFKFKIVFKLDEIVDEVKKTYNDDKKELLEIFFIYKALNELIPKDENDFNNFNDYIYDKFDNKGYIIYKNIYYIYQPYDKNQTVSMYYRYNYTEELFNNLTVYDILKSSDLASIINSIKENLQEGQYYDFNKGLKYYYSKKEYDYIGIIDKHSFINQQINEKTGDVFKIRIKQSNHQQKIRQEGVPKFTGIICVAKKSEELEKIKDFIINDLKSDLFNSFMNNNKIQNSKIKLCEFIRMKLLFFEKYSKNNILYVIVPYDHKIYEFPYNLKDRYEMIIQKLKKIIPNIKPDVETLYNGSFENIKYNKLPYYVISINYNNNDDIINEKLNNLKFSYNNNKWYRTIN